MSLMVDSCNKSAIVFKLKKDNLIEKRFVFDFRYYVPYSQGPLVKSGLYVFKTLDKDSKPYEHYICSIEVF